MTAADPQWSDLLTELAEGFSAVIDLAIVMAKLPAVNFATAPMEQLAAVMQRLEDVRDALREMRDQEVTDES